MNVIVCGGSLAEYLSLVTSHYRLLSSFSCKKIVSFDLHVSNLISLLHVLIYIYFIYIYLYIYRYIYTFFLFISFMPCIMLSLLAHPAVFITLTHIGLILHRGHTNNDNVSFIIPHTHAHTHSVIHTHTHTRNNTTFHLFIFRPPRCHRDHTRS